MEQKIDKRSKEYKDAQKSVVVNEEAPGEFTIKIAENTQIDRLIQIGLPVSMAKFHAAVNNADKTPENYFDEKSDNASRRAQMWLTAGGNLLILRQRNAKGVTRYFGTPAANVIFLNFKNPPYDQ